MEDTISSQPDDLTAADVQESLPPRPSALQSAASIQQTRQQILACRDLGHRDNINDADRVVCWNAVARTLQTLVIHNADVSITARLVGPHRDQLREACLDGLDMWRSFPAEVAPETQQQVIRSLLWSLADDVTRLETAKRITEELAAISCQRPEILHGAVTGGSAPPNELIEGLLEHVQRADPNTEVTGLSNQLDGTPKTRAVPLRWAILVVLEGIPLNEEIISSVEGFRTARNAPTAELRRIDHDTPFASLLAAITAHQQESSPVEVEDSPSDVVEKLPNADRVSWQNRYIGAVTWRLLLGANPVLSSAERRRRRCIRPGILPEVLGIRSLSKLITSYQSTVDTTGLLDTLCDGLTPRLEPRCGLLWKIYERQHAAFEERHLESVRLTAVQLPLPIGRDLPESWERLVLHASAGGLSERQRSILLERISGFPSGTELNAATRTHLWILLRSPSFSYEERSTAVNRLYDATGRHPDTVQLLAELLDGIVSPIPAEDIVPPSVPPKSIWGALGVDRLRDLYASLCAAFETHLQDHGSRTARPYDDLRLLAAVYHALPTTEGLTDPDSVFEQSARTCPERTRLFVTPGLLERDGRPVSDRTVTRVLHRVIDEEYLIAESIRDDMTLAGGESVLIDAVLNNRQQHDGTFAPADCELIKKAVKTVVTEQAEFDSRSVNRLTRIIAHADALGLSVTDITEVVTATTRAVQTGLRNEQSGQILAYTLTDEVSEFIRTERPELRSEVRSLLARSLERSGDTKAALEVMKTYRRL